MKKLFIGFLLVALALNLSIPAFAVETFSAEASVPIVSGHLVISDPSTGEQWSWDLPASDISVNKIGISTYTANEINRAEISVDISEYLLQTMSKPIDTHTVLNEDVVLTAGLEYSANASNNTVSIYRAYGSSPDNGMFYATDKRFYYANPDVFSTIKKTPTTAYWSYNTNSAPGYYYSDLTPFAMLDCKLKVRGMDSVYRDASVKCKLEL